MTLDTMACAVAAKGGCSVRQRGGGAVSDPEFASEAVEHGRSVRTRRRLSVSKVIAIGGIVGEAVLGLRHSLVTAVTEPSASAWSQRVSTLAAAVRVRLSAVG